MRGDVVPDHFGPIAEQRFETLVHRSRRQCPRGAERQAEFDSFGQLGAAGTDRFDPVQMGPGLERAALLFVTKLPALDHAAVHRHPADRHRADLHLEHHPASLGNPLTRVEHGDGLPRRGEPLERAGPRVPRPDLVGRGLDHRGALDCLDHSGAPSEAARWP